MNLAVVICQLDGMSKNIDHSAAFPKRTASKIVRPLEHPFVVLDEDEITICMPDGEEVYARLSDLNNLIMAGLPIVSWGLPPSLHQHFKFVDLQTEAKMILNSHPAWCGPDFGRFPRKQCLDALGVSDLANTFRIIATIHDTMDTPWCIEHAIGRGDYLQALEKLKRRSAGLSLNVDWWSAVLRNRTAIKTEIAASVAAHYPGSRFWRQCGAEIKFDATGFENFAVAKGWAKGWPRSADGRLLMDHRTMDEQLKLWPGLKVFKEGRAAMAALGSATLRWNAEGCVHPGSTPFHARTGRNQPRVNEGFVFAMPPAFRVAGVRPAPGRALVVLDWSKQEPAIAIGLSGDKNYRAAYQSGDLYFECARRAGAVPSHATKQTHPMERQVFKTAMNGIAFGMGEAALSTHIFSEVNSGRPIEVMSRATALDQAREVRSWYRNEFAVLQAYLLSRAKTARARGWCMSSDGWIAFVSDTYGSTPQLINFPTQSEGAVMLRNAAKTLAFESDLDVCQTLHDAIYFNCDEGDVERVVLVARDHMDRAARSITNVAIDIDVKVITHTHPLVDPRADNVLSMIAKWI